MKYLLCFSKTIIADDLEYDDESDERYQCHIQQILNIYEEFDDLEEAKKIAIDKKHFYGTPYIIPVIKI